MFQQSQADSARTEFNVFAIVSRLLCRTRHTHTQSHFDILNSKQTPLTSDGWKCYENHKWMKHTNISIGFGCFVCVCVVVVFGVSHAHQWARTTVNVFSCLNWASNYDQSTRFQMKHEWIWPTNRTLPSKIQQDEISLSTLTLQNLQINGFKTSAINSIFRFCLKNININCLNSSLFALISSVRHNGSTHTHIFSIYFQLNIIFPCDILRHLLSHFMSMFSWCSAIVDVNRFIPMKWFHHFSGKVTVILPS